MPWGYLAAAGAIVTHTHGALHILWQQALLFAVTAVLLQLLQRGTYGDKQKAAALLFGVNVSSITYIAGSFPRIAAAANVSLLYQCATYASVALTLACLYATVVADAGVIATSYSEKLANIQHLVESKSPVATKLCLTCLHRRPLRSKHCPELRACIAKFDHYCPFTLNVIGAENHRAFVGFVAFAELGIALVLFAATRYVLQHRDVVWTRGIIAWLASVVHYEPVLSCVVVLSLVELFWIGYLLAFHTYLVANALTTYEFIKNQNDSPTFSRGSAMRNCSDFFRVPSTQRVDWTRVFSVAEFSNALEADDSSSSSSKRKAL